MIAKKGAKECVDDVDEHGRSALLRHGADPNRSDAEGSTPLLSVAAGTSADGESTDARTVGGEPNAVGGEVQLQGAWSSAWSWSGGGAAAGGADGDDDANDNDADVAAAAAAAAAPDDGSSDYTRRATSISNESLARARATARARCGLRCEVEARTFI